MRSPRPRTRSSRSCWVRSLGCARVGEPGRLALLLDARQLLRVGVDLLARLGRSSSTLSPLMPGIWSEQLAVGVGEVRAMRKPWA